MVYIGMYLHICTSHQNSCFSHTVRFNTPITLDPHDLHVDHIYIDIDLEILCNVYYMNFWVYILAKEPLHNNDQSTNHVQNTTTILYI